MTHNPVQTLPQLLIEKHRQAPEQTAMRQKQRGVWEATSLRDYHDNALDIALALKSDGVAPGQAVLIFGFNSPQWLEADMGAMMCGARSAALYPDMAACERMDILRALAPAIVFCGGHEQVDQILEAERAGVLTGLRRIIHWDPAGLQNYNDERLVGVSDYCARAHVSEATKAELLRDISAADPDEIAVIALTRGMSGQVRSVELSHAALLAAGKRAASSVSGGKEGRNLAYLPLANAMARQYTATLHLLSGEQLCFAEVGQDLFEVVREVQPNTLVLFPNGWEKLAECLVTRLEQNPKLPSRLRLRALRKAGAWFEQSIFARGMRRFIGLAYIQNAFCFGGTADFDTRTMLDKLGVSLYYGYGATELAGVTHVNISEAKLLNTPLPDVALSTDDDGQISISTNSRKAILTGDRFVNTGQDIDLAGRIEDMHNAQGRQVALNKIEQHVRDSSWIKHAAACVRSGKVELLIELDAAATGRWAAERKIAFTNFASLARLSQVRALVTDDIAKRLDGVSGAELVNGYIFLDEPLELDTGELAPLYGMRRAHVAERLAQAGQEK